MQMKNKIQVNIMDIYILILLALLLILFQLVGAPSTVAFDPAIMHPASIIIR
jgi:hypothetical protein